MGRWDYCWGCGADLSGAEESRTYCGENAKCEASEADRLSWDIQCGEESYAERLAEHRSETILFGDSWPGAQCELAETRARIDRQRARLAEIRPAAKLAPQDLVEQQQALAERRFGDDCPF